jgi:Na+-transporting NADH:ubiquinone oxidoreductase subunit F
VMPWIRTIHKWASIIVGIQFLLWLSSGLYFNVMDHTKAAGRANRTYSTIDVKVDVQKLREPSTVLTQFQPSVMLSSATLLSKPVYLLTHTKGLYKHFENHYTLVDAYTGHQITIDKDMANALAKQSYSGSGVIRSSTLLDTPINEFPRQLNATWQVNFDDDVQTSVYVEAGSGRIVGHSDKDKRLADIFFMLHFMDYGNQGGFNSVQMILFAFVSLWLSLTGIIWTIDLGFRGQYQISWFAKKRNVKLFDQDRKSMGSVLFSTHTNLLDGLVTHNIILPSTCGGGGTCGRCKVMINPDVKFTSAEQFHFSDKELAEGYRLACQHFSDDIDHMTLIDVTNAQKHTLELTQSLFISPVVKELRFKVKGNNKIGYKAGAFMRFFIPDSTSNTVPLALTDKFKPYWQHIKDKSFEYHACSRNYSCAMSSSTTDELVFTIKIQSAPEESLQPGVASHYLCNLDMGETVEALGPFEEFYVTDNSNKTLIIVGAGSGMAPLRAIIDEQLSKSFYADTTPREIYFFYGARAEIDLLYARDFYELTQQHTNFHYIPILSKPDDSWLGATGYAQHVLALNINTLGDIGELEFYLCGPQGLMDEALVILKNKGVNDVDVRFDVFK